MNETFTCISLEDTKNAAEYFTQFAAPGKCFALHGNLGYGKTAFAKYFIQTLNPSINEVPSPTFSIIQTYNYRETCEIVHIDCYRLKNKDDFFDIGLDELIRNNITIIEWPEIIDDLLPPNTLDIRITLDENGNRIISSELRNG